MLNPQFLNDAVSAVCPIDGLAILSESPPTVRIDARPEATAQQINAANDLADAWDWSDEAEAARQAAAVKAQAVALVDDQSDPFNIRDRVLWQMMIGWCQYVAHTINANNAAIRAAIPGVQLTDVVAHDFATLQAAAKQQIQS